MKKVPLDNAEFYSEFHKLVCELKDWFEDNDIFIGTSDPAGMTHHEIAVIAAWECFHKTSDVADLIDKSKKKMEHITNQYKAEMYHVKA